MESRRRSYAVRASAKPLYEHAGEVGAMVNANAVKEVDGLANALGLKNIAFVASWQAGNMGSAVNLLLDTERASRLRCFRGRMHRLVWPRHLTCGAGSWIRKGR